MEPSEAKQLLSSWLRFEVPGSSRGSLVYRWIDKARQTRAECIFDVMNDDMVIRLCFLDESRRVIDAFMGVHAYELVNYQLAPSASPTYRNPYWTCDHAPVITPRELMRILEPMHAEGRASSGDEYLVWYDQADNPDNEDFRCMLSMRPQGPYIEVYTGHQYDLHSVCLWAGVIEEKLVNELLYLPDHIGDVARPKADVFSQPLPRSELTLRDVLRQLYRYRIAQFNYSPDYGYGDEDTQDYGFYDPTTDPEPHSEYDPSIKIHFKGCMWSRVESRQPHTLFRGTLPDGELLEITGRPVQLIFNALYPWYEPFDEDEFEARIMRANRRPY